MNDRPPFVLGELTIEPRQESVGEPIELFWRGRSVDRHPAQTVVPYVSSVIHEAARQNAVVRLHFETIEHMNSATITAVIQIIRDARAQKTRLEIVFDRDTNWQRLSFDALAVLLQGDDLLRLVGDPRR